MRKKGLYYLLQISLFSALIAVCSIISIPTPVPFTLQTFAIFTALMTLGGRGGLLSVIIYVALGLVGLPVFSSFGSGVGYLFGASGGFILGFLAAALIYALLELIFGKGGRRRILFAAVGQLVIYAFGAMWFALVFGGAESFGSVLLICVLPYIIPDALKLWLALFVSRRLEKIRGIT